ncbi:hypothetical protein PV325_001155 [Microctonus aethiopoides]|nr:hypothetical protein PV325_001155 [Microctonus aethiopoides]
MTFALLLLSTVFGDESTSDEMQICAELCEDCDGIGSYINDRCECHVDDKNDETPTCIDEIKEKAAEQNLTLVNIQRNLLDRSTRCCPNSGRLRLNDILCIAKYFMNGGARTDTHILGDRRSFPNPIVNTMNCQCCSDDDVSNDDDDDDDNNDYDAEDPSLGLVLPPEESNYLTPTPLLPCIIGPQTLHTIQNSYPYNDYNEPNIPSFDQTQPHDCYSSSRVPPSPACDCSRNQLAPLLSYPYPLTSVPLLSPLNYPKYPSTRVPPYNCAKSHKNGLHRNPLCYYSAASKIPNFGTRIRQPYRPVILGRPRSIVQPLHTLPSSLISPVERLPSNNLEWPFVAPQPNLYNGMNNQLTMSPYSGNEISNRNLYSAEPILGAANPNIAQSNKNHNEGEMLNADVQQVTTENPKVNQLPISSTRSDIVMQSEKPMPLTQMTTSSYTPGTIIMSNNMKRTLPASIRYRQMNKRGLKIIT